MILSIVRLLAAVILAFLAGKLISKLKLPSILGWLIAGMALGPHALSLVNSALLDAVWYQSAVHILECAVGLMIGTENAEGETVFMPESDITRAEISTIVWRIYHYAENAV